MKNIKMAIITVMKSWQHIDSNYDGVWFGFEGLQDEIYELTGNNITITSLKIAMKELKQKKVVQIKPLFFEDKLSGSGYFFMPKLKL